MDLLLPLVSLLLVAGAGVATAVPAMPPNSQTPAAYWQEVLPGTSMPPAISDLLAQSNENIHCNNIDNRKSSKEPLFIYGPRKLTKRFDGGRKQYSLHNDDQNEVSLSCKTPQNEEDQKKNSFSYNTPYDEEDQKKIPFSYKVEDEEHKNMVTSFSYKPRDEEDQNKISFSYKTSDDEEDQKKISSYKTSVDEEDQKKATFSYKARDDGVDQKKVTFSNKAPHEKEDQKKISFSYKTSVDEEDQKKATFSYKARDDGVDQKKVTFSNKAPHEEEDQKKISFSYKTSDDEEDQKKATFSYKARDDGVDQKKVTFSNKAPHEEEDQKKISFSYKTSDDEEDQKKATFSYKAQYDEVDQKKVKFAYKTPHEEEDQKKTLFSYKAPHEAEDQKKILLSYRTLHDDEDHNNVSFSFEKQYDGDDKTEVSFLFKAQHDEEDQKEISFSSNEITHIYIENEDANQNRITSTKGGEHHGQAADKHNHDNQRILADVFFLERTLRLGFTMTPTIPRTTSLPTLLRRSVANSIPFSTDRFADIVAMFAPASLPIAGEIRWALEKCEDPRPLVGEKAGCATSMEDLVELAMSLLRTRDLRAFSGDMPVEAPSKEPRGRYNVTALRKISDESSEMVACHDMTYPYAVFYCHTASAATRAYLVTLVSTEGGAVAPPRMEVVAVCHLDTSRWSSEHPFLQALNVSPGDVDACHFLPRSSIVWVHAGEEGEGRAAQ